MKDLSPLIEEVRLGCERHDLTFWVEENFNDRNDWVQWMEDIITEIDLLDKEDSE